MADDMHIPVAIFFAQPLELTNEIEPHFLAEVHGSVQNDVQKVRIEEFVLPEFGLEIR